MKKNCKPNDVDEIISCNDSSDSSSPEVSNNNIYFYCDVNTSNILSFNKTLRDLDNKNYLNGFSRQNVFDNYIKIEPIIIYIQSYGGNAFSGLSAMDAVLQCRSPIYTVIDGVAASAATFISIVGSKRFITQNSFALIHQCSGGCWGKYEEMKDEMTNYDALMSKVKNIYKKYTNICEKELDEMLKKDIYFDAQKCLELGIVDEIK